MNPTASSFDPSGSSSDSDKNGVVLSYKTLVRCLEVEQDRHEQTQAHLGQALARIEDLEAELNKVHGEKKSLAGSIKMLTGIIQHNKDRLEKKPDVSTEILTGNEIQRSAKDTVAAVPATVTTPSKAISQLATNGHSSVIANIAEAQSSDTALVKQVDPASDQNDLFNLDLLKTHTQGGPDTPASRRSRALRKHFSLDDDSEASTDKIVEAADGADELVHIIPSKADKFQSNTNMGPATPTKRSPKEDTGHAGSVSAELKTEIAVDTPKKYFTAKLQVRPLPSSFPIRANHS